MTDNIETVSAGPEAVPLTRVSAAVMLREVQGESVYLLAQRPPGKAFAGFWEFPGGKVEPGESFAQALVREIEEELGVTVTAMTPWVTRHFSYPHARVEIRFFRVSDWQGTVHPHEHTDTAWVARQLLADRTGVSYGDTSSTGMAALPESFPVSPVLPANTPIMRALALPAVYAVTNAGASAQGQQAELSRIAQSQPMLVQVREKDLDEAARVAFARQVVARVHAYGGRVLLNGSVGEAREAGADGVHLTSAVLAGCAARPELPLVFASCHTPQELQKAEGLGLDAVVVGSVQSTLTHPDRVPLGWSGFAQLIDGYGVPVYAIGGMRSSDVPEAQALGAQGVAMMRGW